MNDAVARTARPARELALLVLLLAVVASAYWPGLSGGFLFDDEPNLLRNPYVALQTLDGPQLLQAARSGNAGPLGRPVAMATFALDHYLAGGFHPFQFKLTNLLIHLLTAVSLWVLWRCLPEPGSSRRWAWLPLVATAIWALHPINVTSVLYIVQRMTSLAALFSVWAMIAYVVMRNGSQENRPGKVVAWCVLLTVCFAMGVLSKESVLLLPAYLFLIELVFYRFRDASGRPSRFVRIFHTIVVAVPAVAVMAYVLNGLDGILAGYAIREFTVGERLLSQLRVLWFYLGLTVLPQSSRFGLFHDDFVVSTGLFEPFTTALALVGWIIVALSLVWSYRRDRLLLFGIGWFLCGHLLESTIWPLEMIHEHRNYLPSMGPLYSILVMMTTSDWTPGVVRVRRYLAIGMVPLVGVVTAVRAQQWSEPLLHATIEAAHHPQSARAQVELGRIYLALYSRERRPELYDQSRLRFTKAAGLKDGVGGYFGLVHLDSVAEVPVDAAVLDRLATALRTGAPSPANVVYLSGLGDCQEFGGCSLSDEQFLALARALRDNPRMPRYYGAIVERVVGRYYLIRVGDVALAGRQFENSVVTDPNSVESWLALAEYASLKGDAARVREALVMVKRLDGRGRYVSEAKALEDKYGTAG